MSIRQKLWGVGGLSVVVFVLLATLAFDRLGNMESLARQVSSAHQVEGAIANAYEGWLLDDDQSNMYAAVIALRDKTQHDLAETTYQQAVDGYNQAIAELAKARGLVSTDAERSALDTISSTLASYNRFSDEMRKRALAGNVDGTVKVMTVENLEPSNALPELFQKLRDLETTRADALQHRMRADATSGKTLIIITALLGLLILGAAITMLVRAITRPLSSVVGALEAVAGGDLTVRLEHRNADEIGRIATALNSAAESLQVAQDDVAIAQAERENMLAEEALVAAERAEEDRIRIAEETRRKAADAEREQERVRAEAEREQNRVREEAEREQARLAEQHAADRAAAEAKQAEADELSRKVDALLQVVDATAAGDFTRPVTVSGSDAIGRLGSGLDSLLQTLRSSMSDIGSMSSQLARAAEELTGVSGELGEEAARTTQRAASVASASDEVAASIETVASSASEMTASINEIARNATDAARVAADAVIASTRAREMVTALGASSEEISGIVDVITSIAKQTNLLALNAHIESARAGEAGRGFAVVANEVKGLAQETERATLDVSQKIAALQSGTRGANEAIGNIGVHVDRINATQATIATAVEEQTATTSEIARHVSQASSAATAISVDVGQVATAAQSSQQGAQSALTAAHHVSGLATQLNDLLGRFRY